MILKFIGDGKIQYCSVIILLCVFLTVNAKIKTSSSSVLNNKSIYSHKNCIDGNFNTAWVEGDTSDGKNEWIKIEFESVRHLNYLGIIPGYLKFSSKGEDLWFSNNILSKATLHFSDSSLIETGFYCFKSIQYIKVNKRTSFVKLIIDSVYNGNKYNDACISEIIPVFDTVPIHDEKLYGRDSGIPSDTTLLEYFNYYYIPPFTIDFLNSIVTYCGSYLEKWIKFNDSTFYCYSEDFDISKGTQFLISSSKAKIDKIIQADEYRWASGGSSSESPFFFKRDSLTAKGISYFTDWHELSSKNKKYEIIKIDQPKSISNFNVKSKINDQIFFNYFDSLNFRELYDDYKIPEMMNFLKYASDDENKNMALLKYATHLKIIFKENDELKRVTLIIKEMYGPC